MIKPAACVTLFRPQARDLEGMLTTNMHTRRRPGQHLDVRFTGPSATEFSADELLGNADFTLGTLTTPRRVGLHR